MEEGGEEAFMELTSVDDRLLCCNEEYWPDVGERIRVRAAGERLEAQMAEVGARVVYLPYTPTTSSTMLRRALSQQISSRTSPRPGGPTQL